MNAIEYGNKKKNPHNLTLLPIQGLQVSFIKSSKWNSTFSTRCLGISSFNESWYHLNFTHFSITGEQNMSECMTSYSRNKDRKSEISQLCPSSGAEEKCKYLNWNIRLSEGCAPEAPGRHRLPPFKLFTCGIYQDFMFRNLWAPCNFSETTDICHVIWIVHFIAACCLCSDTSPVRKHSYKHVFDFHDTDAMYGTQNTFSDHNSNHREESCEYDAQRSTLDEFWGVWKCT